MIFATIEGWARSPQSEGDSGRVRVGGHFWGLWRVFFLQAVKLSPSNRKCRKSKIFQKIWRFGEKAVSLQRKTKTIWSR